MKKLGIKLLRFNSNQPPIKSSIAELQGALFINWKFILTSTRKLFDLSLLYLIGSVSTAHHIGLSYINVSGYCPYAYVIFKWEFWGFRKGRPLTCPYRTPLVLTIIQYNVQYLHFMKNRIEIRQIVSMYCSKLFFNF